MIRQLVGEVGAFLRASLLDPVERTRAETPALRLRRRIVVGLTLVAGAIALGLALAVRPGDPAFYPATLGVAAVWVLGALASGPLHLGRGRSRRGTPSRGILQGFLLGLALLAVFLLGALVVAQVPLLRAPVESLLDHARCGSLGIVALVTVANGVAEELFFRGAAYASLPPRANGWGSALLYAASTLFSGVLLLTFAALCLGLLTAAQRRVTGGVAGPITAHLTWSLSMLFLLPPVLSIGA
ncbi:CPBP family intramembrane glutamic endopeptidase [Propioniciclava sp.]|uniref:CPBP family intramembrane glutamic endopeptidase n=1 Tax=Propioniciclava sp. TaxID=2038686 RepID=UPI00261C185E|nr:CPBP family intramembrane glutamic endopeptidase [Propioniciclava sp.]